MKKLQVSKNIQIFQKGGQLWTTSINIASQFNKKHKNLLQAYDNLKPKMSPEFDRLNFQPIFYTDSYGRKQPMLRVSRDGFTMLVFGFNGKRAIEFKEKYIFAFNSMGQELMRLAKHYKDPVWLGNRQNSKISRRVETDTIRLVVDYACNQGSKNAHRYYTNITKMTYKALLLVEQGLKIPNGLRDLLSGMELSFLTTAEYICSNAIAEGMAEGMFYKEIYKFAKERVELFAFTARRPGIVMGEARQQAKLTA